MVNVGISFQNDLRWSNIQSVRVEPWVVESQGQMLSPKKVILLSAKVFPISTITDTLRLAIFFYWWYKKSNKEIIPIIKDSDDTSRKMKKQIDTLIIETAFGDDVDAKEDKDINPLQLWRVQSQKRLQESTKEHTLLRLL